MQQGTPNTGNHRAATSAVDSLRAHEKMAALMPIVMRLAAIRKDCATLLPAMFEHCAVQRFESGELVLSAPNAAIATKLKQQLPKLQEALCRASWQVSSIRFKVQVSGPAVKPASLPKCPVPLQAVSALVALNEVLETSPRNEALKSAIARMVQRHRT